MSPRVIVDRVESARQDHATGTKTPMPAPVALPDVSATDSPMIPALEFLTEGQRLLVRASTRWTAVFARLGCGPAQAPRTTEAARFCKRSPSAFRGGFLELRIRRSTLSVHETEARLDAAVEPKEGKIPLSYGRFRTEFKLRNARFLLATTDHDGCDIARSAGYTSSAHLASEFKVRFGMGPRAFRIWYHRQLAEDEPRSPLRRQRTGSARSRSSGAPREADGAR